MRSFLNLLKEPVLFKEELGKNEYNEPMGYTDGIEILSHKTKVINDVSTTNEEKITSTETYYIGLEVAPKVGDMINGKKILGIEEVKTLNDVKPWGLKIYV